MAYVSNPMYGSASRKQAILLKRQVKLYQGWYLTVCDYFLFEGYAAERHSIHAILTYSINDSFIRLAHSRRYISRMWLCPERESHFYPSVTRTTRSRCHLHQLRLHYCPPLLKGCLLESPPRRNFKELIEKIWYYIIPQLYISKSVKHYQYEQINDENLQHPSQEGIVTK